jgi:hypothetical protein
LPSWGKRRGSHNWPVQNFLIRSSSVYCVCILMALSYTSMTTLSRER